MANRATDVVGFRRIFVLFVTLVLTPAVFLSGFGILAVTNQRTADKMRQRDRADLVLLEAEKRVATTIRDLANEVQATPDNTLMTTLVRLRDDGRPIGHAILIDNTNVVLWTVPADKPPADLVLEKIRQNASLLQDDGIGHLSLIDGPRIAVMAIIRREHGVVLAYELNETRLAELTVVENVNDDDFKVLLRRATNRDPFLAMETWMRELVEQGAENARQDDVATRTLKAPLDQFVLTARGSPPSSTTSIVYLVLLVMFNATLITGVVITSRLIWQETRLSRLKTDFVSHVSHELRTPLTSIRMFIETLRLGRAQSEEERAECLDLLQKETERLSEMIERVLGYARLQSGRRVFRIEPVNVKSLVDDTLDAFRAHTLTDTPAIDGITVDIPADLPRVDADREAMVEVLLNLVTNAYKYGGTDKAIRIEAADAGKRVHIRVVDHGPGIPKAEWRRIFDRFYQAGNLLSREQSGSGLGLAIARRIVDGHRGKISVRSAPGEGSTFTVEIPRAKEALAA